MMLPSPLGADETFGTIRDMPSPLASSDFYDLDSLLSPADIVVRDSVRKFVDEQFLPTVNKHWHAGTFPMELLPEMGRINCFGATIKGYGCAGLSNLAYGLVTDVNTAHLAGFDLTQDAVDR